MYNVVCTTNKLVVFFRLIFFFQNMKYIWVLSKVELEKIASPLKLVEKTTNLMGEAIFTNSTLESITERRKFLY